MTEDKITLKAPLDELLQEHLEAVDDDVRGRIIDGLQSTDKETRDIAKAELLELWLETTCLSADEALLALQENAEDNELSNIANRLLVALDHLRANFPALSWEIPSFKGQLFSGDPKKSRAAITQIIYLIRAAIDQLKIWRSERYSSPQP